MSLLDLNAVTKEFLSQPFDIILALENMEA